MQNDTSKDKFLILAFPVNKVIQDNEEAKSLIKSSDLTSEMKQEIYLEAEFDSAQFFDKRNTMHQQIPMRISLNEEELNKSVKENFPNMNNESLNFSNVDSTIKQMTVQQELNEVKKHIDEIKRDIQDYDLENIKLNTQLNNYTSNSRLVTSKSKGIK